MTLLLLFLLQNPCAPDLPCRSIAPIQFPSAARNLAAMQLSADYVAANYERLRESFLPYCANRANCLATRGNEVWFCNDLFKREVIATCKDDQECGVFARVFAAGVDHVDAAQWQKLQDCAAQQPRGRMKVWIEPALIPVHYTGPITVHAIDEESGLPVQASVTIDGQNVYSATNPTGRPVTTYAFEWPRKLRRVPNAEGHQDVVPPEVIVEAPNRETVRFPLPTPIPGVKVTLHPSRLRRGRNRVIVKAVDAMTGAPVEMRVMLGDETIGDTNVPVEITIRRGKVPELWVTSLFHMYSDVVLADFLK